MEDTSGVHVWLVLGKAFHALAARAPGRTHGEGSRAHNQTFREHAAAMEEAARVLSNEERLTLLGLLKKLGKAGKDES